jgi:two-component system, cell cycle sensor histidine kinase and response regulator CckA
MKLSFPRPIIACAVYFALHFAAHVSASVFEVAPGLSIWYPPCGLALSLLVLLGPRYAPWVFVTNSIAAFLTPGLSVWWSPLLFPALITLNYTVAACLVRKYSGPRLLPGGPRDTLVFALAIIGAPAGVAVTGTLLLQFMGLASPAEFIRSSTQWWVGDVSGLLTVVPVVMVFVAPWLQGEAAVASTRRGRGSSVGAMLIKAFVLIASLWAVFFFDPFAQYHPFYLCFLPLIWICLRHGLPGATLATLAITMGSLIGLHFTGSTNDLIIGFLLFELTVAVMGLGLGSAVTRRNEAERELAESEALLDRVIAGAQLGLWDWDVVKQQVAYNQRSAEIIGDDLRAGGPVQTRLLYESVHPADRERLEQSLQAHLDGRSPLHEADYRIRGKENDWRWIHARGSIVARDNEGHPLRVSGTHLDVTDRKRAEAETGRLLKIIDTTTDFILTAHLDGRIIYANAALLRLLGIADLDALRGRSWDAVFPEATLYIIQSETLPAVTRDGHCQSEVVLRDGQKRAVTVSQVAVLHREEESDAPTVSFVMRDVTRQKMAEAENIENERKMLHIQKSESLGVLAGGIAHDFNNLLTAMLGNASLARLDLPDDSPVQSSLVQIEAAATRAAELCQQMLAYAGRSPLSVADVDVTVLIEGTKKLLQVSIGKKTQIELQLAQPLPVIRAAPAQMQQIVMNLVLNASEAIGENAGRIVIRTSSRHFQEAELNRQFLSTSLTAGPYVLIEVSDTGCGMSRETLARIFEPFFTTKFTGHGLGLAAVMGIVRSHGGGISVSSTPGRGSTFTIAFPSAKESTPPVAVSRTVHPFGRAAGLALVVDDEVHVRDLVARILSTLGFTVVTAVDGVDAVECFKRDADKLRIVLLDLTMPRMDGEAAFLEMNRINSNVPVVLMSGFSEKLTLERFIARKPAGFLAKPFDLKTVQSRVLPLALGADS